MDNQAENVALDDFIAWLIATAKNEVVVRADQQTMPGNVTMTRIKAYTFSSDGALRHFEYQCCEPLDLNVSNLIKMAGYTPNPEKNRIAFYRQFHLWQKVIPLFMEHKPVIACRHTAPNDQTPISCGSIHMLTHMAMAFVSLQAQSQSKDKNWGENCSCFLRRWWLMYKLQKATAIEHAAALAGIPVLS